jgi:hypothetical protein
MTVSVRLASSVRMPVERSLPVSMNLPRARLPSIFTNFAQMPWRSEAFLEKVEDVTTGTMVRKGQPRWREPCNGVSPREPS